MADTKRPWQGTSIGVIDIIGVVGAFIFAILFLFLQGALQGLLGGVQQGLTDLTTEEAKVASVGVQGMLGMLAGMGMAIGIVLIGIGILAIFMARGAFKGQKWSPVLSIVFSILGILGGLSSISNVSNSLVPLVLNVFVLYCSIMCLKDPFYNQKKA